MSEALHTKYRPVKWEEIVGQKAAVRSLKGIIHRKESQAFLLSGPAGCGKTTIARIAAEALGCERPMETDAATHTGIDAMREIQQTLQYQPFGKSKTRAIILDEAHRLSGQAWDSLLKSVEEPPPDAYWFFCTTNEVKVPKTIQTRCTHIQIKGVANEDLAVLLDEVCDLEEIELSEDMSDLIIREAKFSPRQLLVNLALCRDVKSRREAADILRTALESDAIISLCRFLAKGGGSWKSAMALVNQLDGENPEGVRIIAMNYFGAALKNAQHDKDAAFFLELLQCFAKPYNQAEGIAPLLLSVGQALFSDGV